MSITEFRELGDSPNRPPAAPNGNILQAFPPTLLEIHFRHGYRFRLDPCNVVTGYDPDYCDEHAPKMAPHFYGPEIGVPVRMIQSAFACSTIGATDDELRYWAKTPVESNLWAQVDVILTGLLATQAVNQTPFPIPAVDVLAQAAQYLATNSLNGTGVIYGPTSWLTQLSELHTSWDGHVFRDLAGNILIPSSVTGNKVYAFDSFVDIKKSEVQILDEFAPELTTKNERTVRAELLYTVAIGPCVVGSFDVGVISVPIGDTVTVEPGIFPLNVNIVAPLPLPVLPPHLNCATDSITICPGAAPIPVTFTGGISVNYSYPEDSPHVSGNTGAFVLAVRNDSASVLTSADGDYSPIAVDSSGRIGISDLGGSITVDGVFFQATQPVSIAGSVAVTGPLTDAQLRATPVPVSVSGTVNTDDLTFANDKVDVSGSTVTLSGPISTTIDFSYAEDSVHVSGDKGAFVLAVRNDAAAVLTSANGDYSPIAVDSAGRIGISDLGGSITVDGTVELGATTLAALESITVQNPGGASAVNIQDGGNSITVDGTVSISGTVAVTQSTSPWVVSGSVTITDGSGPVTVDGTHTPADAIANPTDAVDVEAFNMVWDPTTVTWSRASASRASLDPSVVPAEGNYIYVGSSGTWERVIGQGAYGDASGLATGIPVAGWVYNGASWDRMREGATLGSQLVSLDATSLAALESITVQNGAGAAAVNIQDGGNSITVDGSVSITGTVGVTQSTSPWVTSDTSTKAEDSPATNADNGIPILAVRNDAAATKTSADGDYSMLATDAAGRVGIADLGGSISIDDNGGSITVDGTVTVTQGTSPWVTSLDATTLAALESITVQNPGGASAVNIQDGGNSITVDGTVSISGTVAVTQSTSPWVVSGTVTADTNFDYAEDAPHASGDPGAFVLAVRNDANAAFTNTNGDYSPIAVNSAGAVAINDGGNSITVDGTVSAVQSGAWSVAVNNASGAAAVNIQDGGNSITVDGTVAISGTVAVTQSTSPWIVSDNSGTLANGAETAVSSSAVQIIASNANRKKLIVQNTGTANIRVGITGVTATTGARIVPNGTLLYEMPNCPTQAIFAIRESGTDSIAFAEEIT